MRKVVFFVFVASLIGVCYDTVEIARGETVPMADEADVDRQFVTALRERRLFQAAEQYCRDRLARKDLSQRRRVLLLVQYLICLRDHAESVPPPRREELWQSAARTAEEYLASDPADDDAPLMALQFAMLRISQGRLLREEQELFGRPEPSGGDSNPAIEAARAPLRDAIRDLRDLERITAEKLRGTSIRGGASLSQEAWREEDWLGFEKTVQFQLAAAATELALTFPEDGPDRAAALTESQRRLAILARLPENHPLALDSRLALARVYRLLRQWESARAALATINEAALGPRGVLRVRAESLRLAVDAGDREAVERILSLGREHGGETLSVYDFALLEAYWTLRNWAEKDGRPTEPWNRKIVELLDILRKTGDPYWVRRAELFIAGRGGPESGEDDAMTAVAAENAFRAGRIEEALAGYDHARAVAARRGAAADAFRYGITAAAIASERGDHADAYHRFAELADRFRDQPQADQADLMAIHHLGQLLQTDPQRYLEDFAKRIRAFLDRYPGHPQSRELRLRLARSLELMEKRKEAAEEYWSLVLSLPGPSKDHDDAVRAQRLSVMGGFGRCVEGYCRSLKAAGKDPAAEITAAADRLDAWVRQVWQSDADNSAIRDPAVREAVRLSAQMRLESPESARQAVAELQKAIEKAEAARIPQREYADILCLHAVARIVSGESTLPRLNAADWDADTLRRSAQRGDLVLQAIADETSKRKLAEFLLGLTDGLEASRKKWKSAEQNEFLENRAKWFTISGRLDAALQAYAELAVREPARGDVQEAMVLLLVRKGDTASVESALHRLRELTQRSPEGSPRWFRAKYLTAWCLMRLDRCRQAAELIAVVETLYPDLGGDETRELFVQLKRQCASAGK